MNPKISLNNAVNQILTSPAPVLFPDTCSLVDLIRIPFRAGQPVYAKNSLNAATYLANESLGNYPNLWVVIPPPIQQEWERHSQTTLDETTKHFSDLDKYIEIAHASANALNISLPQSVQYSNKNIEIELLSLPRVMLSNAIFLDADNDCLARAARRVIDKTAPARKGKGTQDSTIVEHCIAICAQLHDAEFESACVFISSNTNDFCLPGNRKILTPPLDMQFESVNLSFVTDWPWAKRELGFTS